MLTLLPPFFWWTLYIAGALLVVCGLWRGVEIRRTPRSKTRRIAQLIGLARGLRLVLTGLAFIGMAHGALYAIPWLFWAAVAFGLEELYECSMALSLLVTIHNNEAAAYGDARVEHLEPRGKRLRERPRATGWYDHSPSSYATLRSTLG